MSKKISAFITLCLSMLIAFILVASPLPTLAATPGGTVGPQDVLQCAPVYTGERAGDIQLFCQGGQVMTRAECRGPLDGRGVAVNEAAWDRLYMSISEFQNRTRVQCKTFEPGAVVAATALCCNATILPTYDGR